MQSQNHLEHIAKRNSHNDCQECRADTERRFAPRVWPGYRYVSDYLGWAKPRIEAIRNGEDSVEARIWHRGFIKALHTRITNRVAVAGRKYSDGYLERFRQFRRGTVGEAYLRQFARKGASAL